MSQAPEHSSAPTSQIYIREGFQWDRQEAYLFDIDGTLLSSQDRIHYDSFRSSILKIYGKDVTMDGVVFHGCTDPGILGSAFRNAGVDESIWRPLLSDICKAMCQTVSSQKEALKLTMMPGVVEMLRYLDSQGAVLGVGTGNLEVIGWLKIETLGLRPWFRFGGFSDKFEVRSQMIGHAAENARKIAGPDATVCVVGDTPSDIAAARANSLPTIAVATGHFSFDALMEHEPEVCCTTLSALLEETVVRSEAKV